MSPLKVTTGTHQSVMVDLGGQKGNGYSFVLNFDVLNSIQNLGGGNYAVTWREYPWQRFGDVHTIPEAYNVTLPGQALLLDVVGYNTLGLRYSSFGSTGNSMSLNTNITGKPFGWSMLYRDTSAPSGGNSPSTQPTTPGSAQLLPLLPVTVSGMSVWSAVVSVLLLTASELASPIYSRSGYGFLINRKRLRLAALVVVVVFILTIVFQFSTHPPIQH
jgi:hypothetical protein